MGSWLSINGEAIYGTRPWIIYGEGPTQVAAGSFHDTDVAAYKAEDFRFTQKNNALYAIEMAWPSGGEAIIRTLHLGAFAGQPIRSVVLLGSSEKLAFRQQPDGLHITLPGAGARQVRVCIPNRTQRYPLRVPHDSLKGGF